jgi:hypothetical protein
VRRRLPNTASQKLVDYVKDRLIAKSVALAKWKKARPELFPDSPIGARDVLPGENWIFPDHRTLADVIGAEQTSARVLSKAAWSVLLGWCERWNRKGAGGYRSMNCRIKLHDEIETAKQHEKLKQMLLRLLDDPQVQEKIGICLRRSGLARSTGINVPQRWYPWLWSDRLALHCWKY